MMIKKLFTYSQAIFCMALALSFSACTDEVDRDPSPVQTEGVQAYFYQDAQTSFDLIPDDAQVVQVTVGRNSTGAASVQLTGDNDIFTFPSTVDFQEGETSKTIDVAFDIPVGGSASLTLSLAEGDTYIYAPSSTTITVARNYKYNSIGVGMIESSFYGGAGNATFQKAEGAEWYKVVAPYENGYDIILKLQEDGSTVVVDRQAAASDYGGYGTLYVEGQGTLENGVVTLTLEFTVSAGSFGPFDETFIFPGE